MAEFEPVALARRLVHEISKQGTSSWDEGLLVDYITALTAALREAYDHLAGAEDELDADFGSLLHTIRHLLED